MNTRKISIKTNDSSSIKSKVIEATTMNDVAKAFPEIDFNDTRIVIREPRTTITNLAERLPAGDLFMFTFPMKNKSGK